MARKKANIHYIYKTTCNVTGKWYVGMHSTTNLEDGYMGSGKILRYSIRKHGVENHTKEILEFLPTREELVLRETEIVNKELIGDDKCMNLKEGGCGGHGSKFLTKEQLQKGGTKTGKQHAERMKNDPEYRYKRVKIASVNFKNAHKNGKINYNTFEGKSHSEKSKQLLSEIRKGTGIGETNSQFGTCWVTKDGINKKIKKEDLETYQLDGWLKGRKIN